MHAVCFEGVRHVRFQEMPDPVIQGAGDAIVRVHLAGLCGSDLHPYFGREQGLDVGTAMGHEFVGEIVATGDDVANFRIGDRVGAPFTTNCGECGECRTGLTSRCERGQLFGWRQDGIGLHGGQASLVRVPHADATLLHVPATMSDEEAILVGDNLSTGHFAAELVSPLPDGVYAVVGCGTVGLLAIAAARRLGARHLLAVDPLPSRRDVARMLGAETYSDATSAIAAIKDRTGGRGADGVMEMVGLPPAQRLAFDLVRPGGTIAVIGCHCGPQFAFSPSEAYDKNLTYRTGRCPARHFMSRIADRWQEDPIDLSWCITHRFAADQASKAYDTFAHRHDGCIKAVLRF